MTGPVTISLMPCETSSRILAVVAVIERDALLDVILGPRKRRPDKQAQPQNGSRDRAASDSRPHRAVTARSLRRNRGLSLTAREVERLIASVKIKRLKAASLPASGTPRQGLTRSFYPKRRKQSDFITFMRRDGSEPARKRRAGPVERPRARAAHSVASLANCEAAGAKRAFSCR